MPTTAAEAYDRFIGRYSRQVAPKFLAFADLAQGPVLDVGCGPGELTQALAARFGTGQVAAIDPSPAFVEACRARLPGVDVRQGTVEQLPFAEAAFGGALAQLVLSFVKDGARALAEMRRVVAPGGVIAACSFEVGGFGLVRAFWQAARRVDPHAPDEGAIPYRTLQELEALWAATGLRDVETKSFEVGANYTDFEDYWSGFTAGIGPAGQYFLAQPDDRRAALRDAAFALLGSPSGRFPLSAKIIAIRGKV